MRKNRAERATDNSCKTRLPGVPWKLLTLSANRLALKLFNDDRYQPV